jgi:hypothetical protein
MNPKFFVLVMILLAVPAFASTAADAKDDIRIAETAFYMSLPFTAFGVIGTALSHRYRGGDSCLASRRFDMASTFFLVLGSVWTAVAGGWWMGALIQRQQ